MRGVANVVVSTSAWHILGYGRHGIFGVNTWLIPREFKLMSVLPQFGM